MSNGIYDLDGGITLSNFNSTNCSFEYLLIDNTTSHFPIRLYRVDAYSIMLNNLLLHKIRIKQSPSTDYQPSLIFIENLTKPHMTLSFTNCTFSEFDVNNNTCIIGTNNDPSSITVSFEGCQAEFTTNFNSNCIIFTPIPTNPIASLITEEFQCFLFSYTCGNSFTFSYTFLDSVMFSSSFYDGFIVPEKNPMPFALIIGIGFGCIAIIAIIIIVAIFVRKNRKSAKLIIDDHETMETNQEYIAPHISPNDPNDRFAAEIQAANDDPSFGGFATVL